MGHIQFKQLKPILVSVNTGSEPDCLALMLEAARVFELTEDMPQQEGIPLSSMSEKEFVERFGS